jgi:hypothetical protein
MRILGLALGLGLITLSALILAVFIVGIAASGHPAAIFRLGVVSFILQMGPVLITLVPGLLLVSISRRRSA